MYHTEYHLKSLEVFEKANKKYPWLFGMGYSRESIEVRYYLLEYLFQQFGYSGKLEKDQNGKPIPIQLENKKIHWSVSHSKKYVAYIISDQPTGIDIAEYEERDISLLDIHSDSEYTLLGERNWVNFYILWTAKESIIKETGGKLDNMKDMRIIEIEADNISLFAFNQEIYRIHISLLNTEVSAKTWISQKQEGRGRKFFSKGVYGLVIDGENKSYDDEIRSFSEIPTVIISHII